MKLFSGVLILLALNIQAGETASYLIPAGELLDQDVTLAMTKAQFTIKKGKARLTYELPKEIDGPTPQRFRIEGDANSFPVVLSGKKVNAECSQIDEEISCVMKYVKNEEGLFLLDHEGALAIIDANINLSENDKLLLINAGNALSHEALGIITIKKKSK